jgi:hypothetical protein
MPKKFITERDIDDLQTRGVTSIEATDNLVLTDLAQERALKYGMRITRERSTPPAAAFSPSVNTIASNLLGEQPTTAEAEVVAKIKTAVLAKLDGQVDAALLDAVVRRVAASALK